jgi:hypothetical protein
MKLTQSIWALQVAVVPGTWHAAVKTKATVAATILRVMHLSERRAPRSGNDYFFAPPMYFAGSLSKASLQPAEQK